ncbi:MAG: hypothetical protein MK108_14315 [Mariniblastus sp.]|nr:hypothetical protein [Mariniblastus sp.]
MSTRQMILAMLGLLLVVGTTTCPVAARELTSTDDLVASFLAHVNQLESVDESRREQARALANQFADNSPEDAITEGLIALYPDYAAAVAASDDDDVQQSLALLQPLSESEDRFLAADASFYLARAMMNNEQFEQALPLLKRLNDDLADHSAQRGSATFFRGVAQSGLLQNSEAIASFMEFLEDYPQAAERLRVSAWRQVQQLQNVKQGQMTDIYQRMDFSRRRLELEEPDQVTQEQQDKIVSMLAKLIKEQEKKEVSNSKSNSKNTKQQQQQEQQEQQQQQQASKPNQSQQGGSSSNANGEVVQKSYDDGPVSPWSRLRDRSRDPANNAIKEKLPARYRDIVERYYEAANGNDK